MKHVIIFMLFATFLVKSQNIDKSFYECFSSDQPKSIEYNCKNGIVYPNNNCSNYLPRINVESIKFQCKSQINAFVLYPEKLNTFPNLRQLDISSLKIESLIFEADISNSQQLNQNLKIFKASDNRLTKISNLTLLYMPQLTELIFSDNLVWYMDMSEFDRNNKITTVICSKCNTNTINEMAFLTLENLVTLDLSYNQLRYIHEDFFTNNKKIKKLNLSNNPLRSFSAKLFSPIHNLELLEMGNMEIEKIMDGSFKKNSKLKYLNLRENPLTRFSFNAFSPKAKLVEVELPAKSITELDISCAQSICHFEHFDNDDFFENLRILNMSKYKKQPISKIFEKVASNLETLDLSSISIEKLDASILHRFTNLQHLNLSQLNLIEIEADAFLRQSKLISLDLSDNKLREIISAILGLHRIESLNLEGNRLSGTIDKIPKSFLRLKSLAISRNQFSCAYLEEFCDRWGKKIDMISNPTDHREHFNGIDCNHTSGARRIKKGEAQKYVAETSKFISASE